MTAVPHLSRAETIAIGADGSIGRTSGPGLWPYTQASWRLFRSRSPDAVDPVNLLVAGAAPAAVIAALSTAGWARPDDGATHATGYRGRRVRMTDHAALGSRAERVHVRVFAIAGHTVAAAHHEVADDHEHHIVTSWDRARLAVAEALVGTGYRDPVPSEQFLPRDLRGVPGDGRIWRLLPPAD